VTIRDQVTVEARLADALDIERFVAVLGGSMGGMRALEWLAMYPRRVGAALVLATGAAASTDQIGLQSAQLHAIRADAGWRGGDYYGAAAGEGPHRGLGVARRIAHLSYRSPDELQHRFGRAAQPGPDPLAGGRFAIESYLDHHADKLVERFDAGSYVTLTEAMNTHDLGRDRGGVAAVLAGIDVPVVVAGIDSDRLYPLGLQHEISAGLPGAVRTHVISSPYGHDGFLIETEAVAELTHETLERSRYAPAADNTVRGTTTPGPVRGI
jgi:homoserine O-acetyltransferase